MPETNLSAASAVADVENLPPSSFLTRAQLVPILNVSIPTLKRWTTEGKGPRVTHLENRVVRYRVADVLQWMEGQHGSA